VLLGIVAAFIAGYMIPGYELEPGLVEATPINLVGILAAFGGVTALGTLLGLRYVWDRRFDLETHGDQHLTLK
jgi:hypothetical protein